MDVGWGRRAGRRIMATERKSLDHLIKELPEDSQVQVREFVESLIETRRRQANGHLRQSWAGALEAYRDRFTSLQLQERSLDWRGD